MDKKKGKTQFIWEITEMDRYTSAQIPSLGGTLIFKLTKANSPVINKGHDPVLFNKRRECELS